jgi:hypothetical protein
MAGLARGQLKALILKTLKYFFREAGPYVFSRRSAQRLGFSRWWISFDPASLFIHTSRIKTMRSFDAS